VKASPVLAKTPGMAGAIAEVDGLAAAWKGVGESAVAAARLINDSDQISGVGWRCGSSR
jgi:hypothetical protein